MKIIPKYWEYIYVISLLLVTAIANIVKNYLHIEL